MRNILVAAALIVAFSSVSAASSATSETTTEADASNAGVENGVYSKSDSKSFLFNFPQAVMPSIATGVKCTNHGTEGWGVAWNFISTTKPVHEVDADCALEEKVKMLTVTCQFKTASDLLVKHLNKADPELHAETAEGTVNYPMQECFKIKQAVPTVKEVIREVPVVQKVLVEKPVVSRSTTIDLGMIFKTGKSDLIASAAAYAKAKLAPLGKVHIISIIGHTDDRGGYDYNMGLSYSRAKAVADLLKSLGYETPPPVGYGYTKPLVPNTSDEARTMNRRVEVTVETIETVEPETTEKVTGPVKP